MLGYFLRLGLIVSLFPRARIIHCQRHPLDTCLPCNTQDFASALRFTTDLEHLGFAYNHYRKLMAHSQQVLPLDMITIDYRDMVPNTENQTRELIKFLGLPRDKACLKHSAADSRVATASFLQVRQPVYDNSVGRWKHYRPQLTPMLKIISSV